MQNRLNGLVYIGIVLLLVIIIAGIGSADSAVLNGEELQDTTPPLPEISSVVVEPADGVSVGDTATIVVSVTNNGGPSNEGYISVSFPNNEEVIEVSGTGNVYNDFYPIGSSLHSQKGTITSVDPVAGLSDSNWATDQTESLTIRVKPNVGSSKLQFYVRVALRDSSGSVLRVPAFSGDTDQEGWYVDEHSIDVIEEVTEAPSPVIANVDSETVYEGDTATITISVINNGGPSNEGYVVVSFPNNEEVTDVSGTGNEYNKLFPLGSTIHGKTGSMTSINPIAGLYESNWESDQTERLNIKVKPNAGSSKIEFYVRATLKDGSDNDIRTPSSSAYTDQQGWYVESNSIDVLSSVDLTPPASVTKLKLGESGSTWIRWTWTNPSDSDFSHVMVYIDGAFVTTTSNNYYELTGLTEGTTHTIGLQTVDTTGNINSDIVNDEATTSTTLPEITNVKGEDATSSSITLVWKASSDTIRVQILRDTVLIGDVSGSTSYVDTNLESGKTYNYKLVPYDSNGLKGNAVNVNLKTSSSGKSGGEDGGSGSGSSSKSSSSGGGGSDAGAGSVEDYSNVAVKDVDKQYLRMDSDTLYQFTREGNPIQSISFYLLKNLGEITSTIEVLNGRSKLVTSDPAGYVYKYTNIWVGKSGFATAVNTRDVRIKFKVDSSWLQAMDLSPEDVKLQVYSGNMWQVLPTTVKSNTTDFAVFEAQTTAFGPFAITAEKTPASPPAIPDPEVPVPAPENTPTPKYPVNIWTFFKAFVLIGIVAVGYSYLKRD